MDQITRPATSLLSSQHLELFRQFQLIAGDVPAKPFLLQQLDWALRVIILISSTASTVSIVMASPRRITFEDVSEAGSAQTGGDLAAVATVLALCAAHLASAGIGPSGDVETCYKQAQKRKLHIDSGSRKRREVLRLRSFRAETGRNISTKCLDSRAFEDILL